MNKDLEFLISPGLWKKSHKVAAAIIAVMLLLYIGFTAGSYVTIKAVAYVAVGFIDPFIVEQAVWQYRNQVIDCFPSRLENALNDSNSGK